MHPTCYLINRSLALDAGALTSGLSLEEQVQVDHILLSHSHIDHLYSLPFLLDNVFAERKTPVKIYGSAHTLNCLKTHLFNNLLWPDFTTLSNDRSPILELKELIAGREIEINGLKITPAIMDHTVDCFGYMVDDGNGSAFFFGDTLSVDGGLPLIQASSNLKFVILEASFPNRLKQIAALSRHLTTASFAQEVKKLPEKVRVLASHMKPDCLGEIQIELAEYDLKNVTLIEQGATYRVG